MNFGILKILTMRFDILEGDFEIFKILIMRFNILEVGALNIFRYSFFAKNHLKTLFLNFFLHFL